MFPTLSNSQSQQRLGDTGLQNTIQPPQLPLLNIKRPRFESQPSLSSKYLAQSKSQQAIKLIADRQRNQSSEKKDFKIAINCSIALLDKDYSKLISMAQNLQDKEQQDTKKSKQSSIHKFQARSVVKTLIKSQSQAIIPPPSTTDSQLKNQAVLNDDILESHDIKHLNLNEQGIISQTPSSVFNPSQPHLKRGSYGSLSPIEIRFLTYGVNKDQLGNTINPDQPNQNQKNISSHIQKLLSQKKDKLKSLFDNSEKSKGLFNITSSNKNTLETNSYQETQNYIRFEDIKEDANEGDAGTMDFHYIAKLDVKNDNLQLTKHNNTTRHIIKRNTLDTSGTTDMSIQNHLQVGDSRYQQIGGKTRYNSQQKFKLSNPNQLIKTYDMLQVPMNQQQFKVKGLDLEKLLKFEKMLHRIINPYYSGSINYKINTIDLNIAKQVIDFRLFNKKKESQRQQEKEKFGLTNEQLDSIDSYSQLQQQTTDIIQGFWSSIEIKASQPQSRESARMISIGKKLYMFGGFAREPFNDTRLLLDYDDKFIGSIFENVGEEGISYPQKRFGHSLSAYRQSLVVFGGGGSYNPQAKVRLTLNDVKIFDTQTKNWETDDFIPQEINGVLLEAPRRRMHHAADVYGSMLVVHGGFSSENKETLSDIAIYDLKKKIWVKANVKSSKKFLGRQMHTMTAIFMHTMDDNNKYQRGLWANPYQPKGSEKEQLMFDTSLMGMYLFGGMVQRHETLSSYEEFSLIRESLDSKRASNIENMSYSNELWFIKPDYAENQRTLKLGKKGAKDYEYKSDKKAPQIYIEAVKLEPTGKPPAPRCLHSACQFGKQYLAIFGGRNDNFYKEMKNVALNDLCIYDISKNMWITIANYGCLPDGRFSHAMACLPGNAQSYKLLIFGGQNMKNYCPAFIYHFDTNELNFNFHTKSYKDRIEDVEYEIKKQRYLNN